ncbi:glycoside hydrolase family 31 protein [Phanerochaete sordida]|uniref:Glucosidase II subunit alpha n=1 Tax=Phanerochaete sordida TaxID=48140 RepID=A0A9P3GEL9_9APHY|nr:glycoside hydrolase family 31 protein [Phanerochaete sordida]
MRALSSLLLLAAIPLALAVKPEDFKTCSQAAFCRRGKALADRAGQNPDWKSPYSVDPSSLAISSDKAAFTAAVKSSLYPDIKFGLDVRVHHDGVVRVRMDEVDGKGKRYDETASWALLSEPQVSKDIQWTVGKKEVKATYGPKTDKVDVEITFDPLVVTLSRNGRSEVVLNGLGLLHMEHFRTKEEPKPAVEAVEGGEDAQTPMEVPEVHNPRSWFEGEEEDGYWEETWKSWTDSKPKGPQMLSIDISFPNHGHVYGIPQHATRLSLPTTSGQDFFYNEPYRLWNSDVFEYHADSTMSLYGSIPVMYAHSKESTVGVFNAIASDTFIDVAHPEPGSSYTHWISESGILDVFLLPGPKPADIFKQYTGLTGTQALPPQWSIAYHQCRWNYVSSDDVRSVQTRFDEEDMPVDVFWLDIEYAEEHKYFIWDKKNFPDPVDMVNDVSAVERKMVVIVDPHLKRVHSYPVYKEAQDLDVLAKVKDGQSEYEGWCWSGSSAWVDFFNPASWEWWKGLFKTVQSEPDKFAWIESTTDVHIWNDMNEPAIFNGPEISMPRDNIHYGGWEHRDLHNLNGMLFHNQTSQAVRARTDPPMRPFVLTRSFFAGSQRFGAMWTGDNLGTWEHMAVGMKMVLSLNIAGFAFSGSDVGGFFGNPEPEMLVRWYHVGAFTPFFRAHAHIDTKRREPYLLDEPYKSIVRDILRLRYAMLPIWYTAFHESSVNGMPVVRPHFVVFPEDEAGFAIDDQFFVGGSGLLVKPVTEKGATEAQVYLPEDQVYYDYFSGQTYRGSAKGKNVTVPAPLDKVPLLIRGGSILPTRERPRRSSPLMRRDPFTLTVALDKAGGARGELYLDDGESYAHEGGALVWREFTAARRGKATHVASADLAAAKPEAAVDGAALALYDKDNAFAAEVRAVRVEKLVVLGLEKKPGSVKLAGSELDWEFVPGVASGASKEGVASQLVVKNPVASITGDWEIVIQ